MMKSLREPERSLGLAFLIAAPTRQAGRAATGGYWQPERWPVVERRHGWLPDWEQQCSIALSCVHCYRQTGIFSGGLPEGLCPRRLPARCLLQVSDLATEHLA